MRIKIFLKKLVAISVAAMLAVTLVGCFDLGDFSDDSAYYSAFGDVRLVYQNTEAGEGIKDIQYADYSIRDYFYNKNTGEKFSYGDPKDSEADDNKGIPQKNYLYMAIPVNQDMSVDSFALYFNATQSGSLNIAVYLLDDLPDGGNFTNVKLLNDPEYQTKVDQATGEEIQEPIIYSDPDDSLKVAEVSLQAAEEKWSSVLVDTWKNGEQSLSIKKSQYLLLRFMNNGAEKAEDDIPIAFRTTNLLIRAFF